MSILLAALALAFSVPTVSAQGFVLDYDTAVQLAQLPLDCYRQVQRINATELAPKKPVGGCLGVSSCLWASMGIGKNSTENCQTSTLIKWVENNTIQYWTNCYDE